MTDPGTTIDADEVARAVEGCPSVARLAPGTGVEVATYLPGRRVAGVRFGDGALEVHVVARYGLALPEVADEVREALAPVVGRHPVSVFVDDLELEAADATPDAGAAG